MSNFKFCIQLSIFSCVHAHPHEILESEPRAGVMVVDDRLGDKRRSGERVIEVQVGRLRADEEEPEHRVPRNCPEGVAVAITPPH